MDKNGQTFIKLGWNPIYLEEATPFRNEMPTWGVKIECDGKGCNGLPCEIDPAQNKVNEMVGSSSNGAGGGAFCVVTVPKDVNANFVVFDGSGGSATSEESGSGRVDSGLDESGLEEVVSSISASTSAPSSSAESDSTYVASSSWTSTSSDSSSANNYDYSTTSIDVSSPTSAPTPTYSPHEFFEESNTTYTAQSATVRSSNSQTSPIAAASTGGASAVRLSIVSLVMSSLIVFTTVTFWS